MEYLYVCHFSNGHIKVGRSIDPKSRVASHADRVSCIGIELVEHKVFECVESSIPAEAALIDWCRNNCEVNNKSEWFVGIGYEEACAAATSCAAQKYEAKQKDKTPRVDPDESATAKALRGACKVVGGFSALARILQITPAAVHQWRHNGVPAELCPVIERLTGVRCEDLRPDVEWGVLRQAA